MTYFSDLSPLTYWGPEPGVFAVGWLDENHEFPKEKVSEEFENALGVACRSYLVKFTRGWHECPFSCPVRKGFLKEASGSAELRVWAESGVIYAAPELIHHYVVAHEYRPPDEFVQAVMRGWYVEEPR